MSFNDQSPCKDTPQSITVCIVSPMLPLSGNLTTAHRIASLIVNKKGGDASQPLLSVCSVTIYGSEEDHCDGTVTTPCHFDVCIVIHALRGASTFDRLTALSNLKHFTTTFAILIFGGTDVNEMSKSDSTLSEMTSLMSRRVPQTNEEVISTISPRSPRYDAFVCFSDELKAEAMRIWGPLSPSTLMNESNTFVIPQSVDFEDCAYPETGDGVCGDRPLTKALCKDEPILSRLSSHLLSLRTHDIPKQQPQHQHPSHQSIVLIGGIRPVKGQSFALQAWVRLKSTSDLTNTDTEQEGPSSRHVWFFIIGGVLDMSYLEKEVMPHVDAECSVEIAGGEVCISARWVKPEPARCTGTNFHCVWVHSGLPRCLIPELLSNVANDKLANSLIAVINTSESEGQPQAILEAMACGTVPVVVRDAPGNRCVVRDASTADFVAPKNTGFIVADPCELASLLQKLLFHSFHQSNEHNCPFCCDLKDRVQAAVAYIESVHSKSEERSQYLKLISELFDTSS